MSFEILRLMAQEYADRHKEPQAFPATIDTMAYAYQRICQGEDPWTALGDFSNAWYGYARHIRPDLVKDPLTRQGEPHVVPVGFRYNPEQDSIDIGGHNIVPTKKYRDAVRYGRVAFVVDDVLPPWKPRMVEVRGSVQGLPEGGKAIMEAFSPEILRITPTRIISFGVSDESVRPAEGRVSYSSRKVG